ncbi:hypothetical protein ACWV26_17735 [Rummeliibacillus sp. JY-2-4R]
MIHIYADSAWHDLEYGCARVTATDHSTGQIIRTIEREHLGADPGELLEQVKQELANEMKAEGYEIIL